jgi:hypothetical protein
MGAKNAFVVLVAGRSLPSLDVSSNARDGEENCQRWSIEGQVPVTVDYHSSDRALVLNEGKHALQAGRVLEVLGTGAFGTSDMQHGVQHLGLARR